MTTPRTSATNRAAHFPAGEEVRVLVFPCGSEIGLEIHRSLAFSRNLRLIGASSDCSNHGPYVYREYVNGVPFVDAPDFAADFERLVRAVRADAVFPAHDSVVLALARQWPQGGVKLLTSPLETCRVCRDKALTYDHLRGVVRIPHRIGPGTDLEFPVFVKPAVGQGSRNTLLARNRTQLDAHLQSYPGCLVLEYLPGSEYTVDCFTDRHGALRFCGPRERIRTSSGISVDTVPVEDPALAAMAERINCALRFRGAWFFQVKRDSGGEPALLEVSPRVAGSMALYRAMGVNLPLLSLYDAFDVDVDLLPMGPPARLDRALVNRFRRDLVFEHVYIDLDDTIVVGEKVNLAVAAFLYQCRNSGIRIHLLTRHAGPLDPYLDRFALRQLFDSITRVEPGMRKTSFLTQRPAIFIDDSFAERREVQVTLNLPVFAADAVESLIDWRL